MPTTDLKEFLQTMRDQFDLDKREERDIRKEAETDQRFVAGGDGQWDDAALKVRRDNDRPAMSFNRLNGPVNQLANEARQNKPQVKFTPSDDAATEEIAEKLEGIARGIQYDSDADHAYEIALRCSAGSSFGYYRFTTEYEDARSFNQVLKVEPVIDPFAVYGVLIPTCLGQKPRHAFILESITHEDFKRKYPKSKLTSEGFDGEFARQASDWVSEDRVTVAEYWWVETTDEKIAQLEDGTVVPFDELPEGVEPRNVRIVPTDHVHSCLTNGLEILDDSETEWPDELIPIWLVPGEVQIVGGKVKLFSLIRFSRDPQQLVNFAKSRLAELLGTSPISPWIAQEGVLEGYEDDWNQAHVAPKGVLYHKARDLEGNPAGAPQRNVFEPPIQALSAFIAQEIDDLKASTNIYDASLGAQGNETSGRAINARQRQSSLSNFHFIDNLSRTHKYSGRAMGRLIQKLYDTGRTVRTVAEDESESTAVINKLHPDPATGAMQMHDVTRGCYAVRVSSGPGYSTRRAESYDLFTQLAQGWPALTQIIGDIILRSSDIPGSEEAADRLKKMLPPQLQEQPEGAAGAQTSELQAKISQGEQVIQQLQAQVQEMSAAADVNKSRERVELAKLEVHRQEIAIKADIEMRKMGSAEAMFDLEKRLQAIEIQARGAREDQQQQQQQEREALPIAA